MIYSVLKVVGLIGSLIFGGIELVGEIGDAKEEVKNLQIEMKNKKNKK